MTQPDPVKTEKSQIVLEHVLSQIAGINTESKKDPVAEKVIADLGKRADEGVKTYGVYLHTHNGRDALQDAYEEVLDAMMYIMQAHMEEPSDKYYPLYVDIEGMVLLLAAYIHNREKEKEKKNEKD